jgi:hypothetical protein
MPKGETQMEQQNQQVHPLLREVLNKCLQASAEVAQQAKQQIPAAKGDAK